MTYQLYYSPAACSLAVHIMLEELGQAFELQLVTNPRETGYLAINPKGRVPVLMIPGEPQPLTELPVILTYLAQRHPEASLLPDDALTAARCHEWLAWLAGWVHGVGFGALWRPERFITDPQVFAMIQAKGKIQILDSFRSIEKRLGTPDSALASGYTLVDPFLLVLYAWGERINLPMDEDYPAWTARTQVTLARPAVIRALEREGIRLELLSAPHRPSESRPHNSTLNT